MTIYYPYTLLYIVLTQLEAASSYLYFSWTEKLVSSLFSYGSMTLMNLNVKIVTSLRLSLSLSLSACFFPPSLILTLYFMLCVACGQRETIINPQSFFLSANAGIPAGGTCESCSFINTKTQSHTHTQTRTPARARSLYNLSH